MLMQQSRSNNISSSTQAHQNLLSNRSGEGDDKIIYFAQGLNFATILTFPGANLWLLWSVSRLGSFEILMSLTNPCFGRDLGPW